MDGEILWVNPHPHEHTKISTEIKNHSSAQRIQMERNHWAFCLCILPHEINPVYVIWEALLKMLKQVGLQEKYTKEYYTFRIVNNMTFNRVLWSALLNAIRSSNMKTFRINIMSSLQSIRCHCLLPALYRIIHVSISSVHVSDDVITACRKFLLKSLVPNP